MPAPLAVSTQGPHGLAFFAQMSSQGQGGSSPFLRQSVPVLASSVSTSVPGWGLNLSSNHSLQGLSGSAASPWSPRGYWGWGGRPACYLATSASHLCGDLAPPCSPPHVWTPTSDQTSDQTLWEHRLGPGGRAGMGWGPRDGFPITPHHLLFCRPHPSWLFISPESLQGHYP